MIDDLFQVRIGDSRKEVPYGVSSLNIYLILRKLRFCVFIWLGQAAIFMAFLWPFLISSQDLSRLGQVNAQARACTIDNRAWEMVANAVCLV